MDTSIIVDDGQSKGTEYRYLTDRAKAFCLHFERQGHSPTLGEALDYVEAVTAGSLLRFRDHPGPASASQRDARAAAHALRHDAEALFTGDMGMGLDQPLRNGLVPRPKRRDPVGPTRTSGEVV